MTQEARSFGIRQLLAEVNLRDFSRMVLGELALVSSSVRLAVEERQLLLPLVLLVALLRLLLLALVVVVLGGAILVITLVRGVARLRGGGTAANAPE